MTGEFSKGSAEYHRWRPTYPAELFAWIQANCSGNELVWDIGTGTGQAVNGMVGRFDKIKACDINLNQIEFAPSHKSIKYIIGKAEEQLIQEDGTVDAITCACSLHWLDLPKFFRAVTQALKPGGLIVAWTYEWPWTDHPPIDALLEKLKLATLKNYWLPQSDLYLNRYRDIFLPCNPIKFPKYFADLPGGVDGLFSFLKTWSPVIRYQASEERDPLEEIYAEVAQMWLEAGLSRVRLPLYGVASRKAIDTESGY